MKKIFTITVLFLFLINNSIFVYADNNFNMKLKEPKLEIPKFNIPDNMPDPNVNLKELFDNVTKELEKQGFGVNNYPNGFEELKTPEIFKKRADKLFKEKYGELWTKEFSNKINNINNMPSNNFFNNYSSNLNKNYKDNLDEILKQFKTKSENNLSKLTIKMDNWNTASNIWGNMIPSSEELKNYKKIDTEDLKQKLDLKEGSDTWKKVFNNSEPSVLSGKINIIEKIKEIGKLKDTIFDAFGFSKEFEKYTSKFSKENKKEKINSEEEKYKEIYKNYYKKSNFTTFLDDNSVNKIKEVNRIFRENKIFDPSKNKVLANDPIYMGKLIEKHKDLLIKENPEMFGDLDKFIKKYDKK